MWRWLIVLVLTVTIVATSVVAYEWARRPKSLAAAEQAWGQAGIENYRLDIAVDECMMCGGPGPLRSSVVVTNGQKTSETDPPNEKPGFGPTIEDLFRMIEANGQSATVMYNDVGVPKEIRLSNPDVADSAMHETITFTET
jgi:hypothetical protein